MLQKHFLLLIFLNTLKHPQKVKHDPIAPPDQLWSNEFTPSVPGHHNLQVKRKQCQFRCEPNLYIVCFPHDLSSNCLTLCFNYLHLDSAIEDPLRNNSYVPFIGSLLNAKSYLLQIFLVASRFQDRFNVFVFRKHHVTVLPCKRSTLLFSTLRTASTSLYGELNNFSWGPQMPLCLQTRLSHIGEIYPR